MRVPVAEIVQHRLAAIAVDLLRQPDLAGTALHLVALGMLGLRHRPQRAAEFNDVPIAVVPVLQQRKIVPDFVDGHDGPRSPPANHIWVRKRSKASGLSGKFRPRRPSVAGQSTAGRAIPTRDWPR